MARQRRLKKKKPVRVNKSKRINALASDIKALLKLDECVPVLEPGLLWLRMKSDDVSLDVPVGLKPLFDPQHDNTPSIQQSIIKLWIAHLQNLMRGING